MERHYVGTVRVLLLLLRVAYALLCVRVRAAFVREWVGWRTASCCVCCVRGRNVANYMHGLLLRLI